MEEGISPVDRPSFRTLEITAENNQWSFVAYIEFLQLTYDHSHPLHCSGTLWHVWVQKTVCTDVL
jgi:hypothetical protein